MKLEREIQVSPQWIWDETLDYAGDCGILYHDVHLPYYVSSIGAHIVNQQNKAKRFFGHTGENADLRLHTLMVAPPGYSKTLFQQFLFNRESGLIAEPVFPSADITGTTEAGLVGSVDSKGKLLKGSAEKAAAGFIYTDELSSVLNQTDTSHSKNLLDHLCGF
jgi:hypothetical protein